MTDPGNRIVSHRRFVRTFFLPVILCACFLFSHERLFSQPVYSVEVNPGAPGGYYFLGPYKFNPPAGKIMILDSTGKMIYYRTFSNQAIDFKLLPNGQIVFFTNNRNFIMNGAMNILDTIIVGNGFGANGHDFELLPNGNYLLFADEKEIKNLSSYNFFLGNNSPGSPNATVTSQVIQEQDPSGTVVWEWHSKDHFSFNNVDPYWLSLPARVDWTHCNAIHPDTDGNILLSTRHFNEITKINKTTGAIMWRFGGKNNEFSFIGDTVPFFGQHDVRRLPNGNITLYDNGMYATPHASRALEYKLDEVNKTAQLVWSYSYNATMNSNATGNVQRLGDGNTLVNYGSVINMTNTNVCFNVVDSMGGQVFKIAFDDELFSYRSFNFQKLPPDFIRPVLTCRDSAGVTYLDAGAGFSSYKWNTGETTRLIKPLLAGIYDCFLPIQTGGIILSKEMSVTDPKDLCGMNAIPARDKNQTWTIYPNPASSYLIAKINRAARGKLFIRDMLGNILFTGILNASEEISIDVTSLPPGLYMLEYDGSVGKFVKE
jgi:hypothetical protein